MSPHSRAYRLTVEMWGIFIIGAAWKATRHELCTWWNFTRYIIVVDGVDDLTWDDHEILRDIEWDMYDARCDKLKMTQVKIVKDHVDKNAIKFDLYHVIGKRMSEVSQIIQYLRRKRTVRDISTKNA